MKCDDCDVELSTRREYGVDQHPASGGIHVFETVILECDCTEAEAVQHGYLVQNPPEAWT